MFGEDNVHSEHGESYAGSKDEMLPRLGLLGLAGKPAKSVATKAGP